MKRRIVYLLFLLFFISFPSIGNAQLNYIVLEGDTLWGIAINHQVSLEEIIRSNQQIIDPNLIYPGQVIIIPSVEKNGRYKTLSKEENRLAVLLNKERIQIGKKPLTIDESLSKAAALKAIDMIKNNYIAHISPTYGSPASMLKKLNITFYSVNETIGAGDQSAELVLSTWMNSSSNRVVILNEQATKMGIGYAKGGTYGHYWTVLIIEN
jgi:spore coat assembly protein SafA